MPVDVVRPGDAEHQQQGQYDNQKCAQISGRLRCSRRRRPAAGVPAAIFQVMKETRRDAHQQQRYEGDDADEVAGHPLGAHLDPLLGRDKTELDQAEGPGQRGQRTGCQSRNKERDAMPGSGEIKSVAHPSAQWNDRRRIDTQAGEPAVDQPEHVGGENLGRRRTCQVRELQHAPDHLYGRFKQETPPAKDQQREKAQTGRQIPQADDAKTIE